MGGLLDLDPTLVEDGLPGPAGEAAAVACVPFVTIPPGPWSPDAVSDGFGRPFAMLVADGLLVRQLWLSQSAEQHAGVQRFGGLLHDCQPADLHDRRETHRAVVP